MKYLLILLAAFLVGCYTPKKAAFQVTKAQGNYPEVVADKCANFYPTKDSVSIVEKVIKGATDTMYQDVIVDCDTITEVKYKNRVITKRVPKYIKQNDTILITKEKVVENTAKLKSITAKLASTEKDNIILSHKLNKRNGLLKWLLGFVGLGLILFVAKLKFKLW